MEHSDWLVFGRCALITVQTINMEMVCFHILSSLQGAPKPMSDCPGQVEI